MREVTGLLRKSKLQPMRALGGMAAFRQVVALTLLLTPAIQAATQQARPVEFHLAKRQPGKGLYAARVVGKEETVYLRKRVELDDRDIGSVEVRKGPHGESTVRMYLTPRGLQKMRTLCAGNLGETLAIVVEGEVIADPVIKDPPTDEIVDIEGVFSEAQATKLARQLSRR